MTQQLSAFNTPVSYFKENGSNRRQALPKAESQKAMPSWAPREKFHVIPLFQLLITSLLFSFSNTFDTITPTHFISDSKNQALWSSNGNFKLGFFSPGNSQNRYVGIWFNKLPTETVVWVANRGAPLKNSTGIFKIADDGNLAVFYENGKTPIWSSDASVPDYNSTARLLPSGNLALVIRNKSRNSEFVVWQSFDYPTNTILPGMKIGLDKRTGRKPILTCWKSSDDPAPGEFSTGLDPQGSPQFFLYKNSIPYWRGGPWNGITLSGVPDVRNRLKTYEMDYGGEVDIFNYNFDINQNEISFSFEARNGTIPSILVLEPQGILERLIWWESRNSNDKSKTWARFWVAPEDLCDQYARCGDSAICNTNNALQCTCLPGFKPLYPQDWYINCVECWT